MYFLGGVDAVKRFFGFGSKFLDHYRIAGYGDAILACDTGSFDSNAQCVAFTNTADLTVRVWNIHTGQQLRQKYRQHGCLFAEISPDCRWIANGPLSEQSSFDLWSLGTIGFIVKRFYGNPSGTVASLAFSPDGQWIISNTQDGILCRWEIENNKTFRIYNNKDIDHPSKLYFSRDGKWIISKPESLLQRYRCYILDASNGQTLKKVATKKNFLDCSSDKKWIFSYSCAKIGISSTKSGQLIKTLSLAANIQCVALSRDNKYLACALRDRTVRLLDIQSGELLRKTNIIGQARCIAFTPNQKYIVFGEYKEEVVFWNPGYTRHLNATKLSLLQYGLPPYIVLDIIDAILTLENYSSFHIENDFAHYQKITSIITIQRCLISKIQQQIE